MTDTTRAQETTSQQIEEPEQTEQIGDNDSTTDNTQNRNSIPNIMIMDTVKMADATNSELYRHSEQVSNKPMDQLIDQNKKNKDTTMPSSFSASLKPLGAQLCQSTFSASQMAMRIPTRSQTL